MNSNSPEIPTIEISRWLEFEKAIRDTAFKGWAFRGQGSAKWPIMSSLSRHLSAFNIHPDAWPIQEYRILRLFKRKSHLFLQHIPKDTDTFQWLGLMQHHGCPTRLIDFTWSPEVAAFFSIERAQPSSGNQCAVWAISIPRLWETQFRFDSVAVYMNDLSLRHAGNYTKYYLPNDKAFISTDDPFVMNQRIIAQSGTFVVPGLLDRGIESIVAEVAEGNLEDYLTKFVIDVESVRADAMKDLYRMNINNATLFPGLDGTARSLAYELENHWAYDTKSFQAKDGYEKEFARLRDHDYIRDP
jgi:hypothetical protein